jgi:hypothetical protein
MTKKTQPPGFRLDFPETEMFWAVRDKGKDIEIQVDRLTVLSDRFSVSVMYGGDAAKIAKNRIQLPRDADFLRALAKEFENLADEFD